MRNKYEASVSHLIVKRRKKLGNNLAFRNRSDEESCPEEPDSSEWDGSDSEFEGGKKEKLQRKSSSRKKPSQTQKPKKRVKKKNRIVVSNPPKLKRNYLKIESRKTLSRKLGEIYNNSKLYSRAVDLYLEDHCSLFGYQDYDESMQPDEPEYNPDNYFNPDDDIRIDEYSSERENHERSTYLKFSKISPIDDMYYMPPPFRHRFEI